MPDVYLSIGSILKDSVVDGPGLRHVLFLAGCSHVPPCAGCHNPHLWSKAAGKKINIDELLLLLKDYINGNVGLTISGGEPLDQYNELRILLTLLNRKRYHTNRFNRDIPASDIVLYTGYTLAEVQQSFDNILKYVDILIDGRYDNTKPPAKWRGSNNQNIWHKKKNGLWLLSNM